MSGNQSYFWPTLAGVYDLVCNCGTTEEGWQFDGEKWTGPDGHVTTTSRLKQHEYRGVRENPLWHDTPPTKEGRYWVKRREGGVETVSRFDPTDGDCFQWFDPVTADWCSTKDMVADYQFGPRIPTAAELAELPGIIESYAEMHAKSGKDKPWDQMVYLHDKISEILGVADDAGAD